MKFIKRLVTAITISLLSFNASYSYANDYMEGVHYKALARPLHLSGNHVEVMALFWHGCPHCYRLDPFIQNWQKERMPAGVKLTHLPTILSPRWVPTAQAFYTAQALGIEHEIYSELFYAIHVENRHELLSDKSAIATLFAKHKISAEKFNKTWNSFTVKSKVKQAEKLSKQFVIDGVPAIVVQGKYITDGSMAGSYEEMLRVMEHLIAKEMK